MAEHIEQDYLSIDKDVRSLVDWENPPTVAQLKNDVSEAMPSHQLHIEKVNGWLRALKGRLNIKTMEGRSKVQPKLIRKQNEWRYASLEDPFLSTKDMFKISPVTHLDQEAAKQNELIINKQFRTDIPKVDFINKFIRKAVDTGTVVIKLEWEEEFGVVREEQMQPVFAQTPEEFLPFAQELLETGQVDEATIQQLLVTGEFTQVPIGEEPVTVMVEKKRKNRPVLTVKDSRSVIIDPSCEGDINKAQFIVDKFLTDLSSLRKDGRYDPAQLDKIQSKSYDNRTDEDYDGEFTTDSNFKFQDRPRQKLVAYEYWGYWDIHDDGIVVPIVATYIGDVMIRLAENPYPDKKLPFVIVRYLPPSEESVYGEADASLLEDNQSIIGAITRGMIDLMGRSANAQQGVRKDLLDPLNRDKFNKGLDFEFNPVSGNLQDAMFMTKFPEIPKSALEMIQLMNNDAEAISGVRSFNHGISHAALGNSATEVRSAMDATARRELGILRRLAAGLEEVGRKIVAMNSVWLDDEEIIRITDDDFVRIKRDDLAGNFDLALDISTAEADNAKAQELAFMLQTIGQTVPFDILKIILVEIAELRKMPVLAKSIRDFEPQPDPLAQAKTQAEIEYLQANTQKDVTAAEKNVADAVLKEAKAQEAGAKGRKINSEADLDDLNYLEQSSGLNQDRELERIEVQERMKALNKRPGGKT